ncbi:MAG: hypothetical protein V3V82_01100, partial [Acidimicrobiia bacterium]
MMARGVAGSALLVGMLIAVLVVLISFRVSDRASGAPPIVPGDVNCDGSVNPVDALLILRSDVGLPVSADCMAESGDVYCSGTTDVVDALVVLRYSVGLPNQLPPGCPPIGGPVEPPVEAEELALTLVVSAPPNGTHFVAGDQPVVTVTLADGFGRWLYKNSFDTLSLYMHGPQDTTKTKTAVEMLNAETDRSLRPHHYIDLTANPDVQASGNVLTYTLQPVTDEEAGTYIVSVRAVSATSGLLQQFPWVEVQIRTATVENPVVDRSSCQACHEGADSGKLYLHHIDPGRSPTGSWALDVEPRTCNACHNNDGYAAYRGDINDPTSPDSSLRTPDPTVRRVHGLHKGSGLENDFNIDPDSGNFSDYIHVTFPADVRNCTSCHLDSRYKDLPSRTACGSCHDNSWFGEVAAMPSTFVAHLGGPQADDTTCSVCHPADSGGLGVAVVHAIDVSPAEFTIDLALSAPSNDDYYADGETPTLTIAVEDAVTTAVIDPNTMTEAAWNRFRLQVSGPRSNTQPVLTTAAADNSKSGSSSYIYNDLRVRTDPLDEDPNATRSPTGITYQLADVAGLETGTYTVFVQTRREGSSAGFASSLALLNFQVGTATLEPEIAENCATCHGDTRMHGSYPFALGQDLCDSCHDYEAQIAGSTGWTDSNNGYG